MHNSSLKQKIIVIVAIIGTALIFIFQQGLYSSDKPQNTNAVKQNNISSNSNNEDPKLISTIPENLNEAIILPTQVLELTFNHPLENPGEFKHKFEPKIEYTLKLSDDKKTVKITPKSTFQLGTTYTLFIYSDETKFDGGKRLNDNITLHFKTIEYKGI